MHKTSLDHAYRALTNLKTRLAKAGTDDERKTTIGYWKSSSLILDDSLRHTMEHIYAKKAPAGTLDEAMQRDMERLAARVEAEQARLERCRASHAELAALLDEGVAPLGKRVKREEGEAPPAKRVKRERV
jgi:hypothetical protein